MKIPHPLTRFAFVLTLILASVCLAESPDVAAALADRSAHYQPADYPYIAYLSLRPQTGEHRTDLERAIKLAVASDSTQPVLERCVPTHVNESLLRIDLRDLRWTTDDWRKVAYLRNPYSPKGDVPLVIPAAWLLVEMSDARESDTYNRLIFGGDNLPKTKEDVFKFFGVVGNEAQTFGFVEGQSGVSVQGTRLIESLPIPRTWAWITSDVLKLDGRRHPLENLDGFTPDGQEGIIGLFKQSITTGQMCGLQWYWLNNSQGNLVNEAPGNLVLANPHFRKSPIIVPPGACVQCHQQGSIATTNDVVREFIKSGAKIYAHELNTDKIETSRLTSLTGELQRAGDQFTLGVALTCGCAAVDASKSYKAAIDRYDEPLDLEQTAAELDISVDEWTQKLALNGTLTAQLASLAHGGKIARASWEESFIDAYYAVNGGSRLPDVAKEESKPEPVKPVVKPAPKPAPVRQQQPQQFRGRR